MVLCKWNTPSAFIILNNHDLRYRGAYLSVVVMSKYKYDSDLCGNALYKLRVAYFVYSIFVVDALLNPLS